MRLFNFIINWLTTSKSVRENLAYDHAENNVEFQSISRIYNFYFRINRPDKMGTTLIVVQFLPRFLKFKIV